MTLRMPVCAILLLATAPAIRAQEMPKPGPEHEVLKKLSGDWTVTMKFGDMESKGTVTWKMDVGGMWLAGTFESEIFGSKFSGRSLDSYDATKKKFVSVWVDSMAGSPVITEGTFDKDKKTLTLEGSGPGQDGKTTKYKSTSVMTDDDTINFTMYIGDVKEPTFTITYKRKK